MKYSGQKIDQLIGVFHNDPYYVTNETAVKINELYDILNVLEPNGDDEKHVFWFCADRGGIEDYYESFEEMKMDGIVKIEEEYEKMWQEDFPDEVMWFRFTSVRYKEYINIFLNGNLFISVEPNSNKFPVDLTDFVDFLKEKAKETVEKVRQKTYQQWLNESLPLKYRYGTIKTEKLWKLRPEMKEALLENIDQEMIDKFVVIAEKDGDYNHNNPPTENLIPEMTAQKYMEISEIGYRAVFPEEVEGKTVEDMYKRWADGRDGGFLNLPRNDPEAFLKWYELDTNAKWEIDNPSHLWEAIQGGSRTRMHLFPVHTDGGWYFTISNSNYVCPEVAIKFYVALSDAGIPVRMYSAMEAMQIVTGSGLTGIIPCFYMPYEFHYGGFPVNGVMEFINIEQDQKKSDLDIEENVEWLPVEALELVKTGNSG